MIPKKLRGLKIFSCDLQKFFDILLAEGNRKSELGKLVGSGKVF